jgi:hypothetical protein
MVNQLSYLEVLTRLQESLWMKRPEFWPDELDSPPRRLRA